MSCIRSIVSIVVLGASLTVAACIDAPQLSSASPSEGSGGASGVSSEREGMVLVPAVTLGGAVEPTGVDPQGNGKAKDKDDNEGKGSGGGGGGGAADAGSGGGADAGEGAASAPPIAVPAFWMDVREVTAGSYRECLDAGACTAPTAAPGSTLAAGLLSDPVNCVSLDQARAFCTWSTKRLVKDGEWTAAAAGTSLRPYPWGSAPPAADRLNACGSECAEPGMYTASDGHVGTAPGGSFPLDRTPDGVEDLGGNVSEWVDSAVASIVRGASYADTDVSFAGSMQMRAGAGAGPSVGFRCAADR